MSRYFANRRVPRGQGTRRPLLALVTPSPRLPFGEPLPSPKSARQLEAGRSLNQFQLPKDTSLEDWRRQRDEEWRQRVALRRLMAQPTVPNGPGVWSVNGIPLTGSTFTPTAGTFTVTYSTGATIGNTL